MKRTFWTLLPPLVLLCSACTSSTESAFREILRSAAEAPVFLGCRAVSERELVFQFSVPVGLVSLNLDPPVEIESVEEGAELTVRLARPPAPGARMIADLLVEDQEGNTLAVLTPFRARNNRLPKILITELRTEYSTSNSAIKVEFVELRTLGAGNLGALRLFTAGAGLEEPVLEFPPVEAAAGEYILVHLRTKDNETGWADETGTDLGLSGGTEALATARDFWIPESKERLRKTDAVFLMDQDDRIIDAVLLSENPDPDWDRKKFPAVAAAAELFGRQDAWLSAAGIPGPREAVQAGKTSASQTICRDEEVPDHNGPGDWYVTVRSGATPGQRNNVNRLN